MYSDVFNIIKALSDIGGISGFEDNVMEKAEEFLPFINKIEKNLTSGFYAFMGDENAEKQIMLDAHIDQIGMMVTEIDSKGFLHVTNVGGIDRRTLPGSIVTVYGEKKIKGIVSVLPPHISESGDKVENTDKQYIDIGLNFEEASKIVSVGDAVILENETQMLLNNRVTGSALDDRAGCAAVIRACRLLKDAKLKCGVHICLSSKEEIGGMGAEISAKRYKPTHAIAVDVSFAKQQGLSGKSGLGELGAGPMIGISPVLSKTMTKKLTELCKKNNIPYQLEVMGGSTGTDCDDIITQNGGVHTALLSIPQRSMHTPAEICDLEDIENLAKLIALYVLSI
ncbi:MAG: M42 family metallopeptidase [Ruminococcaceae bacterium]|nr:M42 family metallopeptidase [Oscillospiraceae bacterium]